MTKEFQDILAEMSNRSESHRNLVIQKKVATMRTRSQVSVAAEESEKSANAITSEDFLMSSNFAKV